MSPHPAPTALSGKPTQGPSPTATLTVVEARRAGAGWAARTVAERLRVIRRLRALIVDDVDGWARVGSEGHASLADALASEVLPLLDACRFLERRAAHLLAPRPLSRTGRARWLGPIRFEQRREPLGVVLVVGPGNYPLLLPAIQSLQALVAGNAVVVKPAPGGTAAMARLGDALQCCDLPPGLFAVLSETPEDVVQALDAGVDKVVLTGSSATGRALLPEAARRLVPAVAELSGCDPCFVLRGADLDLVTRALRFGLRINAARTCIAPRRILVLRELKDDLVQRLESLADLSVAAPPPGVARRLGRDVATARAAGAVVRSWPGAAPGETGVTLVLDPPRDTPLITSDVGGPVLAVISVDDEADALVAAAAAPYGLGASIFGEPATAARVARRVAAGFVCVGDLIAPSADPRVAFGGRGASGFGLTRGAEGLLEMTCAKTIATRSGRRRRHLDQPRGGDEALLGALARVLHSEGLGAKLRAVRDLIAAAQRRGGTNDRTKDGRRKP